MATQKRVGVVLSGCGFLDGAEIHEATCTLLSLDRRGAKLVAMAPDVEQMHVVDHLKGAPAGAEKRRVLEEAARIVRGQIVELSKVSAKDLDALVFPGGFGVAKNLCTFATEGRNMRVLPEVERLAREMRSAGKPQGYICIAPVIAAKLFGADKVKVTIGNDRDTAAAIESWGARHVECKVEEIAVDERLEIATTPAYMLGPWIAPIAAGIDKLVSAVLEMA
ncbi:MAG TPA: isoprenoid biosynthesis glyoxalase ElbB [Anaeromyxobacter sp.]